MALADGLSYRSAVGYTDMQAQHVIEMMVDFVARELGAPVEALT